MGENLSFFRNIRKISNNIIDIILSYFNKIIKKLMSIKNSIDYYSVIAMMITILSFSFPEFIILKQFANFMDIIIKVSVFIIGVVISGTLGIFKLTLNSEIKRKIIYIDTKIGGCISINLVFIGIMYCFIIFSDISILPSESRCILLVLRFFFLATILYFFEYIRILCMLIKNIIN